MQAWSLNSWRQFSYLQAATYTDQNQLNKVVKQLSLLPPLVTSGEIKQLKHKIACAGRGEAFILQGGDCAESFKDCRSEVISNKLKILLQMSLILLHDLHKPIICIGRIAGQYAKPRSAEFETKEGIRLPSYRGDIVNSPEFSAHARRPNAKRLLQAYSCSAITLNFIRALLDGGFADLHHVQLFVEYSSQKEEYQTIVRSIKEQIGLVAAINAVNTTNLSQVDFYTSHEALHLHYEQALTRKIKNRWYNLSTHLPWIGVRTAQLHSAHVEFFRGVENPVGIKIGPSTTPQGLIKVLHKMNPHYEEGKILLFTRFGAQYIEQLLPPLITAVQQTSMPVTWSCDPMHGNTECTAEGVKTRHFDNILNELKSAAQIHTAMNSHLGGVHFELTGEHVTECIGGARGLDATDLKRAYQSLVDPRLNYEQSLEMAIQLSNYFNRIRKN